MNKDQKIMKGLDRLGFESLNHIVQALNDPGKSSRLNEREILILQYSYRDLLSLSKIGELLGISATRVRQIRQKALLKLSNRGTASVHKENGDIEHIVFSGRLSRIIHRERSNYGKLYWENNNPITVEDMEFVLAKSKEQGIRNMGVSTEKELEDILNTIKEGI